MTKIHFISGLPRSGSTLLAAILRQNPRFHAGMSSALFPMFGGLIGAMGGETRLVITQAQRERVLKGLFQSWAADVPDDGVLFDTNRGWTARMAALGQILPDARMICMVRSVPAIMDSVERLIRANPLLPSRLFNDEERANIYTRTEALSQRNRMLGSAWCALKEAYFGPDAGKLLVIEYGYLASAPKRVMKLVYEFIGEPEYEHDFENVIYDEPEFDDMLATPGLHRVHRQVRFIEQESMLPPDLQEKFLGQNFWQGHTSSKANVVAPRPRADG